MATDRKRTLRNQLWGKYSNPKPSVDDNFFEQLQIDEKGNLLTKSSGLEKVLIREHSSDSTITFIGKSKAGTSTSSASWLIIKLVESGNNLDILSANGLQEYNQIFDDRESLTYS